MVECVIDSTKEKAAAEEEASSKSSCQFNEELEYKKDLQQRIHRLAMLSLEQRPLWNLMDLDKLF